MPLYIYQHLWIILQVSICQIENTMILNYCSIVKLLDFAYNIRKGGKGDQYEKNDAHRL